MIETLIMSLMVLITGGESSFSGTELPELELWSALAGTELRAGTEMGSKTELQSINREIFFLTAQKQSNLLIFMAASEPTHDDSADTVDGKVSIYLLQHPDSGDDFSLVRFSGRYYRGKLSSELGTGSGIWFNDSSGVFDPEILSLPAADASAAVWSTFFHQMREDKALFGPISVPLSFAVFRTDTDEEHRIRVLQGTMPIPYSRREFQYSALPEKWREYFHAD